MERILVEGPKKLRECGKFSTQRDSDCKKCMDSLKKIDGDFKYDPITESFG